MRDSVFVSGDISELRCPDGSWDFFEQSDRDGLHGIHSYPAKFIPQIPRKAILEYTKEGDVILDPFCGSGTTLLEAQLLLRKSIGVDNNGVACAISRAKTQKYTPDHLDSFINILCDLLERKDSNKWPRSKPVKYSSIEYWFSPDAIIDLGILRAYIKKLDSELQDFFWAIFSSIIVRNSYQDSDTRYARIDRQYNSGDAIKGFITKSHKEIKKLESLITLPRSDVDIFNADSTDLSFILSETVDLVVTSPPYLNAFDYHKYHRHRLHWLEKDISFARDREIGKHDEFTRPNATPDRYFQNMSTCFNEWTRVLKKGGTLVIIVGDSIVNKKPVPVGDMYCDILKNQNKMQLLDRRIRRMMVEKKSFNPKNSRLKDEHVLIFKK